MADANLNIILKVVNQATKELAAVAGSLRGLGDAASSTAKSTGAMAGSMATMQKGLGQLIGGFKLLAGGWVALKALQLPLHMAEAAGEAEALAKGLNAIGEAAGYSETQLKGAVEEMEKLGITSTNAQKNLSKLITSNVSLESAKELGESAKRIAGALGKSTEEVFQTLAQGVSSGTTRLLRRQFGIVLNEQIVYQREAQRLGRELFSDERREALARAVNELVQSRFKASDATETLSQKQDALRVATDRMNENLGHVFLPAYKAAIDLSTAFAQRVADVAREFIQTQKEGAGLIETLLRIANISFTGGEEAQLKTARERIKEMGIEIDRVTEKLEKLDATQYKARRVTLEAQLEAAKNAKKQAEQAVENLLNLEEARKQINAENDRLLARAPRPGSPGRSTIPDAQRLQEEKQRAYAEAKARSAAFVQGLEDQIAIAKAKNQEIAAAEQLAFDRGLISIEQYYAGRRQRTNEEYDFEISKAQAAAKTAAIELEKIKGGDKPGGAEQIAAQAALDKANRQAELLEQQKKIALLGDTNAQLKAIEDRERTIRDIRVDTRAIDNSYDLTAAIDAINNKYADQERSLKKLLSEQDRAAIAAKRELDIKIKTQEISEKIRKQEFDLAEIKISQAEAQIALQSKGGEITASERMNSQNELVRARIRLEEEKIRLIEEDIRLGRLTTDQVRDGQREVEERTKAIMSLRLQIESLGESIRQQFTGELSSAFEALIMRTKTFKEALVDFAMGTLRILSKAISDELSQAFTKGIVSAGGGDNGIFKMIGDAISGGAQQAAVIDQATLAQELQQDQMVLAQEAAQDQAAALEEGIMDDLFLLGLQTVFESFLIQLEAVLAANAAGSAAGSGFAIGGMIRGPSHSGGGVNINAEGGEYVINKRATRKWGPLLDAINFGGRAPSLGAKTRYADGGEIPMSGMTGDSKTEINIEINDSQAKVSGNGEKAAEFAKQLSGLVQQELVKQKRPGGLLS